MPRPKKRERFGDGIRDATTRGLQRTTSCGFKNGSKCGGALVTSNGANAKEAVTAKLPWQDNVNAAVDVAWHTHPLCTYLIAGPPRAWWDRGPSGQWEKHNKRNKVRSNNEETGSVQSTLKVSPSSGSTERETLPSCDGRTKKSTEDLL